MRFMLNLIGGVIVGTGFGLLVTRVSPWFALPIALIMTGIFGWLWYLGHLERRRTIREAAAQTERPESDFRVRGTALLYDGKRIRDATVMTAMDLCDALGVEPWGYLTRKANS